MNLLPNILNIYRYYHSLGRKAIDQCSDEGLFKKPNETSNSIAIIVKHIHGNMLSRWTNFLTEDGEKEWRDRDGEFEATITQRDDLINTYEEGWKCLLDTLSNLKESDLQQIVYIRNQGHTALEAINRQMAHIPYHIGQIVYLSRMYAKDDWQSLSIPKGQSKQFNEKKFSKEKQQQHFTNEFLDDEA